MGSHDVVVNGVVPFPVPGVRFPLQAVMQLLQWFGACLGSAPDNFMQHIKTWVARRMIPLYDAKINKVTLGLTLMFV